MPILHHQLGIVIADAHRKQWLPVQDISDSRHSLTMFQQFYNCCSEQKIAEAQLREG